MKIADNKGLLIAGLIGAGILGALLLTKKNSPQGSTITSSAVVSGNGGCQSCQRK